eukprot:TRINITY_DN2680_c0_g3_i2.p1 TRINITY_DN2680_c0_g3~~TRINITY_DN2680_c0_g3_i2.p1  ORF type:complete len:624 (+),score=204.27 TRINITY_DN2680_c0_g3_i2:140-2011(+)
MSEYEQLQRGVAKLQELFPDQSIEDITSALLRNRLQVNLAADELLANDPNAAKGRSSPAGASFGSFPEEPKPSERASEPKDKKSVDSKDTDKKAQKMRERLEKLEKEVKLQQEKKEERLEKLAEKYREKERERAAKEERERAKEAQKKDKDDLKKIASRASATNFRHSLSPPGPGRPTSLSMSEIERPSVEPSLLDLTFDAPTPTLAPTPMHPLSSAAQFGRPRAHTVSTPPSAPKIQRQDSTTRLTSHFGGLDFFSTSPLPTPPASVTSEFDPRDTVSVPMASSGGSGVRRLGAKNPFAAQVAPPSGPPVDPVLDAKARTIQKFLRRTMFRCAFASLLHGIKQRNKVMRELVSSESIYVDSLAQINNKYLQPIQSARILDDEQVRSVFLNTVDLLHFHSALLRRLNDKLKSWSARQTISDVFATLAENIGMYEQFVNGHNSNAVAELSKNNKKFSKFLQKTSNALDAAGGVRELSALLICPVQRIPRYKLLLADLQRCTPDFFPAFEDYVRASDTLHDLCAQLNKARGVFDEIGMPHKFRLAHSDRSQWCYFCNRVIWPGLNRQIYFCNQCQQAVHRRCQEEGAQAEYCFGRRPDSSGTARCVLELRHPSAWDCAALRLCCG